MVQSRHGKAPKVTEETTREKNTAEINGSDAIDTINQNEAGNYQEPSRFIQPNVTTHHYTKENEESSIAPEQSVEADFEFFLRRKEEKDKQPKRNMTQAAKERRMAEEYRKQIAERELRRDLAVTENSMESPLQAAHIEADRSASVEVSDSEESDSELADRKFRKYRKEYKKRKKEGKITMDDEINYSEAKAEYTRRQRQRLAEGSDTDEDIGVSLPLAKEAEQPVAELQKSLEQVKAWTKARERTLVESQRDLIRGAVTGSGRGKRGPAKRSAARSHVNRGRNKRHKQMGNLGESLPSSSLSDLYGGDTLGAARENEGLGAQAALKSRKKDKMFVNLMTAIPKEDKDLVRNMRNDKKMIEQESKKFRRKGDCMPISGEEGEVTEARWSLKGLQSILLTHQMLGVSWMIQRESADSPPFGGILADEMGIGKTVIALGNVVNAVRASENELSTLIVVPPSLLNQWSREICKHVDPKLKLEVCTLTSAHRSLQNPIEIQGFFSRFKIVLTTYNEILGQFPKYEPPLEMETEEQKLEWWKAHSEGAKGPIFKKEWQRVIFDEAHICRNWETRTSLAAVNIYAKNRWLLTGTPLINTPEECFSYFRMLNISDGDIWDFRRRFLSSSDGEYRLRVYLNLFLLRRTYETRILNQPIVQMPDNDYQTKKLEFSEFEQAVYDVVYLRFVKRIQDSFGRGSKDSRYSHMFTLLLRLRQMTSHVFLVQEAISDLLEREDFEMLMRLIDKELEANHDSKMRLALKSLRNGMRECLNEINSSNDRVSVDSPEISGLFDLDETGSAMFESELKSVKPCLKKGIRKKGWEDILARSRCVVCGQLAINPYFTSCGHLFCYKCLPKDNNTSTDQNPKLKGEGGCCPKCKEEFTRTWPLAEMGEPYGSTSTPSEHEKYKTGWLAASGHLWHSTKLLAVKEQILEWLNEDPDEKIIVFSQFINALRYAALMVHNESIGVLDLDGSMSKAAKDRTIDLFGKDPSRKVLFSSLKVGGTGLNLVMSNKVINMEVYWNEATESQAYCRVFRIGQEKKTKVRRFVINGSIDDRMLQIQARKTLAIEGVMNPKDPICRKMALEAFGLNEDGSRKKDKSSGNDGDEQLFCTDN